MPVLLQVLSPSGCQKLGKQVHVATSIDYFIMSLANTSLYCGVLTHAYIVATQNKCVLPTDSH